MNMSVKKAEQKENIEKEKKERTKGDGAPASV
jgi:hypothetical protein